MVTLKKLLLLMSVVPSVTMLAMDSKQVAIKTASSNANNNDNNQNSEERNPATSVITASPVGIIFPANVFDQDKSFSEYEWYILNNSITTGCTQEIHQKILAKNKLIIEPMRESVPGYDPKKVISIPNSDNVKTEKKNKNRTFSIEYEYEKRKGPKVYVRQYDPNHPKGAPIVEKILDVMNDREVVSTTINEEGSYAVYADDANQIRVCSISQQGVTWGDPIPMVHGHESFDTKYVNDETKEEKTTPLIKSLSFVNNHVLAVKIPNCVSLIHLCSNGNFVPLRCFEAPEMGTGWVSGTLLKKQYHYKTSWIKEEGNRPEDFCLIRVSGNDVFDRLDRFSLDLVTNRVTSDQVLYIALISFINKLTKENSATLGTPLLHKVKSAYKDPVLKTFSSSVEQQYKKIIEIKAKEIGLSLK